MNPRIRILFRVPPILFICCSSCASHAVLNLISVATLSRRSALLPNNSCNRTAFLCVLQCTMSFQSVAADDNQSQSDDEGVKEITRRMIGLMGVEKESSQPSLSPSPTPKGRRNEPKLEPLFGAGSKKEPVETVWEESKKFERVLARQLYDTTQKDREAMLDEIHGVKSRAVPETEEKISAALEEIELEISNMVDSSEEDAEAKKLVKAHVLAVEKLGSTYVQSRGFRIRFLRTEFFDTKLATLRYFRCLNHLFLYFGENSLLRPLRVDDLSLTERTFLENGTVQALRSRDRMGRRVFVFFGKSIARHSRLQRQKVETYLLFGVIAEDLETQRHGAVAIAVLFDLKGEVTNIGSGVDTSSFESDTSNEEANSVNSNFTEDENMMFKRFINQNMEFRLRQDRSKAIPMRWSSVHFLMPKGRIYHVLKAMIMALVPYRYRTLSRTHIGSYLECMYQLKQFGIPIDGIPGPSAKGVVTKTKSLARFVKCRISIDSFRKEQCMDATATASSTTTAISERIAAACPGTDCPESNCVVFGDRMTYTFPANIAFRDYLRSKEKSESLSNPPAPNHVTAAMQSPSAFLFGNNSKASLRLNTQFLDRIIDELCHNSTATNFSSYSNTIFQEQMENKGFRFATYDKDAGWYRYIDPIQNTADRIELRKRISQTIRDDRKRTLKNSKKTNSPQLQSYASQSHASQSYAAQSLAAQSLAAQSLAAQSLAQQPRQLPTYISLPTHVNNTVLPGVMGIDPSVHFGPSTPNPFSACIGKDSSKRFKTDHCWAAPW